MAIYLLHVKTFGRATGGRVTRAAAYRAGEKIRDERTREVYNFCDREDVVHKEILLPSQFTGNPQLDWARDRSNLWNAAEHTDRRNARLGRELLVVLPPELTAAQRTQLVRRFSQDLADRYQSAVDATIHLPRPSADERHHHAHLLMTARQVTPGGLGPRTTLELSFDERRQQGLCTYKADFVWAREQWAQVTNEALKEAGLTARVDHRGHRALGINHEPVPMIPQKILYMERKTGVPTKAGDEIRRRYRERVEARQKGPEELARVLQKQKEEARERLLERARLKSSLPKKLSWSALTKEEIAQRRRARYQLNKDALNQKRREKSRALSPEQRSVQRWLKWRARHKDPTAQTPNDSVKQWLAYREAHQHPQPNPTTSAPKQRERISASHAPDDADDLKRKTQRDHDYDLEL